MTNRHEQLKEQFKEYDEKYPDIWREFVEIAFELIGRGYQNGGAKAIIEIMRWERGKIGGDGEQDFKMNAMFTAFYARKFHGWYPRHDGFFRTRRQWSKDLPATNLPPLTPKDWPYETKGE